MDRYEFRDASSQKFWEVDVENETLTVRFGKIGTAGQVKAKSLGSREAAEKERVNLVREKTGKGYVAAGSSSAPATAEARAPVKTEPVPNAVTLPKAAEVETLPREAPLPSAAEPAAAVTTTTSVPVIARAQRMPTQAFSRETPDADREAVREMVEQLQRYAALSLKDMRSDKATLGQSVTQLACNLVSPLTDAEALAATEALKTIIAKQQVDFEGLLSIVLHIVDGTKGPLPEPRKAMLGALIQAVIDVQAAADVEVPIQHCLNGLWITRGCCTAADLADPDLDPGVAEWGKTLAKVAPLLSEDQLRLAIIYQCCIDDYEGTWDLAKNITPKWRNLSPSERATLIVDLDQPVLSSHDWGTFLGLLTQPAQQDLWKGQTEFIEQQVAHLLRNRFHGRTGLFVEKPVLELAERTIKATNSPLMRDMARELRTRLNDASNYGLHWQSRFVVLLAQSEASLPPTTVAEAALALAEFGCDVENMGKPTRAWLKKGHELFSQLDLEDRIEVLETALAQHSLHSERLRSNARTMIFLAAQWPTDRVAPILANFARKECFISDGGIRDEKVGNACLWALINMPDGAGVSHLARLLTCIKYPKVKKKIETALNEAAKAAGISRRTLDELSVPTHDLSADGVVEIRVGDGRAVLKIVGTRDVEISWIGPNGKASASVPAALKSHKDEIKAIREMAKDIETDLGVQVQRLQKHYLDICSWTADVWQQRYLNHPLVSGLTRRLIWNITKDGQRTSVVAVGATLVDVAGKIVPLKGEVTPWHPVTCPVEEVLAWRTRLAELSIVQPYKQAHREVYLVTDAERNTGTYSNRFAGHIVRQHQMMTLARLNGWMVTHRIWADTANSQPWHILLSAYGLTAEYWNQPLEVGDNEEPEVTDGQAYVYLSTDQLRFYRIDPAAPSTAWGAEKLADVRIDAVPPIVLSEIMRHCDLYTGVASISSDPAWQDGGARAEHPSQWSRAAHAYARGTSTADLTAAGDIRKQVLAAILPRLAIADRCTLNDRYLRVQGNRRAYKIHLGSGNILMEPNDQYVCIVESRKAPGDAAIKLPFEGDAVLSLILSKAALLVEDDKITDPTIISQIAR